MSKTVAKLTAEPESPDEDSPGAYHCGLDECDCGEFAAQQEAS